MAASSSSASLRSMASSSLPISTSEPRERSSDVGNGIGDREAYANREPAGSRHVSSAIMSSDSVFSTDSTLSSTNVIDVDGSKADVNADRAVGIEVVRVATASITPASIGWTRLRAMAVAASSNVGSLSPSSTDTQATSRGCFEAHSASNVVLPYPGGATTATTGSELRASMRSTRRVREMIPSRGGGGCSLAARTAADPSRTSLSSLAPGRARRGVALLDRSPFIHHHDWSIHSGRSRS